MKEKRYSISVLGNKNVIQVKDTDFYTTDTDAWLIFKLSDNGLNPEKATITLINSNDKSVVSESIEVEDNTVKYHMRSEIISHGGQWKLQFIFDEDINDYTSAIINFKVHGHIMDNKEPALEIIDNWNTFMQQAEDFMIDIDDQLHELPTYARRIGDLEEENESLSSQLAQTTNHKRFHVTGYGAVGDGLANDTNSIREAIQEAEKVNGTVVFPEGYRFLVTDTIDFGTEINVLMESPIVLDSDSPKPAIIFGKKTTTIVHKNSKFWAENKNQSDWLDYSKTNTADTMSVGVKLINVGMSELEVVRAIGFTIGVEALAHSGGFYFNQIQLGQIRNNKSGIEVVSEEGGWPNGNDFFEGYFSIGSGTNPSIDRVAISSVRRSGSYTNNSNIFHNPKIEMGTNVNEGVEVLPISLEYANEWQILNVRGENFATHYVARFNGSSNNTINFRLKFSGSAEDKFEENGSVNNSVFTIYEREKEITHSLNKFPVFDTGIIKEKIIFNKDNPNYPALSSNMLFYHIGRADFQEGTRKTIAGSVNPNFDDSGGFNNHSSATLGIIVDTSVAKHFLVENPISEGKEWGVILALFNENNENISSYDNMIHLRSNPSHYPLRWFLNPSNQTERKYTEFKVNEDVKSVIVMVSGYTRRWQLFSLDSSTTVLDPTYSIQSEIFLASPNNTLYALTVNNDGVVSVDNQV